MTGLRQLPDAKSIHLTQISDRFETATRGKNDTPNTQIHDSFETATRDNIDTSITQINDSFETITRGKIDTLTHK
jgi:hypothetical protein